MVVAVVCCLYDYEGWTLLRVIDRVVSLSYVLSNQKVLDRNMTTGYNEIDGTRKLCRVIVLQVPDRFKLRNKYPKSLRKTHGESKILAVVAYSTSPTEIARTSFSNFEAEKETDKTQRNGSLAQTTSHFQDTLPTLETDNLTTRKTKKQLLKRKCVTCSINPTTIH